MNNFPQAYHAPPRPFALLYPGSTRIFDFPAAPHKIRSLFTAADDSLQSVGSIDAPKLSQIYNTVRYKIINDRVCAAAYRPVIKRTTDTEAQTDTIWRTICSRLLNSPLELVAVKHASKDDYGTGFMDKVQYPDSVFINVWLILALEQSIARSDNEKCVSFIMFTTILHELAHWAHGQAKPGRNSGSSMEYIGFQGDKLGRPDQAGESGYFLEGKLFGGIVCYGGVVRENEPSYTLRSHKCQFKDMVVIAISHGRNKEHAFFLPLHIVERQMCNDMYPFRRDEMAPISLTRHGDWRFRYHRDALVESRRRHRQPTDLNIFPILPLEYAAIMNAGLSMERGDFELLRYLQSLNYLGKNVQFIDREEK